MAPSICLSFFYHMYGEHMGSLELSTKSNQKATDVLWSKGESQGDQWQKAEVTIKRNNAYQVLYPFAEIYSSYFQMKFMDNL